MPGGVGGQRRKPLPTRLGKTNRIETRGAAHRNINILSLSASPTMYLRKLSVKIPDETALIGFDDTIYFDYTQSIDKISEAVFRILLKQLEKKQPHETEHVRLPVDIIIRESSIKSR